MKYDVAVAAAAREDRRRPRAAANNARVGAVRGSCATAGLSVSVRRAVCGDLTRGPNKSKNVTDLHGRFTLQARSGSYSMKVFAETRAGL